MVLPGAGEAAVTEQINRLASMNSVFTYRPKDSEYTYKLGEYSVTKAWEQNRFSSDFSGFWPVIGENLTTMSIDKDLKVRMPVWGNRWEEPEELRGHLEDAGILPGGRGYRQVSEGQAEKGSVCHHGKGKALLYRCRIPVCPRG